MNFAEAYKVFLAQLEAEHAKAMNQRSEAIANGCDEYERGYWRGYEHALADLTDKIKKAISR